MAGKKHASSSASESRQATTASEASSGRKRWTKLTPRDHVLKQVEIQREFVDDLRAQLQREEKTLEGMEKAKEFFPE